MDKLGFKNNMLKEVGINRGSVELGYWIYSVSKSSKSNIFVHIKQFMEGQTDKDPATLRDIT